MSRQYIRHHWIANDKQRDYCFVCGITERVWEKRIENASMLEWDCLAVQERSKPKPKIKKLPVTFIPENSGPVSICWKQV